jgi:MFS family permease
LVNEVTMNMSFFLLFPFIATHLARDLGFATWTVGLILGVRVFCQQGLTVLGGTLGDRFGYKPVIVIGLALRSIGFLLFGLADTFWGVMLAAVLTGLAGSLFSPALRAYVAVHAGPRRAQLYAILNVCGQTGLVLGPLLGSALVPLGFQALSLLAAGGFTLLFAAQWASLPGGLGGGGEGGAARQSVAATWLGVVRNRDFMRFALVMSSYFTLYNQIYIGLPLEMRRLTGGDQATGIIFLLVAGTAIALQGLVSARFERRFGLARSIAIGMGVYAVGYVPVLLSALFAASALSPAADLPALAIAAAPVAVSAFVIGIASLVVQPFANALIPRLAWEQAIGTHIGFYWMFTGITATIGNTLLGLAFDAAGVLPGLPWISLIVAGLASAAGMALLSRGAAFREAPRPA